MEILDGQLVPLLTPLFSCLTIPLSVQCIVGEGVLTGKDFN
jgi:hypothetical protein